MYNIYYNMCVTMDNIVLFERCISNLISIYHYKKLSKQNIHGYYFIKLFIIIFSLKYKKGANQNIVT